MMKYRVKKIVSILLISSALVACNQQTNSNINNLPNSNNSREVKVQEETNVSTEDNDNSINHSIFEGGSVDIPVVSHEELIAYELYRPFITKEQLIEEGYILSATSAGNEYSNDYATYFFMDDMVTPYAMKIFNTSTFPALRGIEIKDPLEKILKVLPNMNQWSNDFSQSYIYGSIVESDGAPTNAAIANFFDDGVGSLSITTEGGLPYIEFTFKDWNLVYFTYFYEYIN